MSVGHRICKRCARIAEPKEITGTHAGLFTYVTGLLNDRDGDIWVLGDDGLLHTPETAPFTREHVERKWGPLTPAGSALELIEAAIDAITPNVVNRTAAWSTWNNLVGDPDFVNAIITVNQARRVGKPGHA